MIDKDTFIALFLPTILTAFAFTRARNLQKLGHETKRWVTTRGRVLDAKIVGWGRSRHAQILYEYNAPTKLVGSQLCAPGCEESDPNIYIRWYTIGKEIHVHYNPTDPQQCLLELPNERAIKSWKRLTAIGLTFPFFYLLWLQYLKTWIVD